MSTPAEQQPSYEDAYAEHREPLIRFTRRLATRYGLPDPDRDAEDIVQATFEDALRQWATVEQPVRWLYTVVRRKVVKAAREAARLGALIDGDDLDRAEAGGWTSVALRPTPEDIVATRQVLDAIAGLPDRQRTVTYLRHVQGWTVQEVADLLDCASGTISAHTNHGVATIREQVGQLPRPETLSRSLRRYWRSSGRYSARAFLLRRLAWLAGGALIMAVLTELTYLWAGVGWTVPWRQVGVDAAALAVLFVVAAGIRLGVWWWWRRRCTRRS